MRGAEHALGGESRGSGAPWRGTITYCSGRWARGNVVRNNTDTGRPADAMGATCTREQVKEKFVAAKNAFKQWRVESHIHEDLP